jgi:hypothetical protein
MGKEKGAFENSILLLTKHLKVLAETRLDIHAP